MGYDRRYGNHRRHKHPLFPSRQLGSERDRYKMVMDIGLVNIYKGILPFRCADFIRLALVLFFPGLALFLVKLMGFAN